jgi:hypothetical protein
MLAMHPIPDGTLPLKGWCKGQNGIPARRMSGLNPA